MSDEIIGFKINLEGGNAEKTVKSFKAELREANNELIEMAEKFGQGSTAAKEAAKRVAELRDRLGDARSMADAFNPDAKFNAITQSINGAAGAFSAYQGALGALGFSTEGVEKQLIKLQSAMALSSGLSSFLDDGIQGFKNLGLVVGDVASKAFGSLKNALISTGIGALIVGIGILIANFDELSVAIGLTTRDSQRLGEVNKAVNDSLKDVYKSIQDVQQGFTAFHAGLKSRDEALKIYNETLGDNLGYAKNIEEAERNFKTKTKDYVEAATLRATAQALLNKQIENNVKIAALQRGDTDQISMWQKAGAGLAAGGGALVKVLSLGMAGEFDVTKTYAEVVKDFTKSTIEDLTKDNAEIGKQADAILLQVAALEKVKNVKGFETPKNDTPKPTPKKATPKKVNAKDGEEIEIEKLKSNSALKLEIKQYESDKLKEFAMLEVDYTKQANEAMKATMEERAQASQEMVGAIGDSLMSLSDIIGRETEVGRGLAITSTLIDTFQSAQIVFRQSAKNPITTTLPAYPYIMTAPAVLGGIARVKAIASAGKGGANGGGGGAPSAPSIPRMNTITELNKGTIDKLGDKAQKAYILETDIADNKKRIERINIITKFK